MIMNLFLSLMLLSALAAVLALLLEVADAYLADYGEKHILVNEEKDLLVKGGKPLLQTLAGEGIFIPSACGGKGTCAYCKVKIENGGGPVLPTERPYLTADELTNGSRLSCQVKVKEDLTIQIPEELFLVKEYRVKVELLETLTPEIKGITFNILEPEEGITFKPGQYIQLEVPKYKGTRAPEYRAYSICSDSEIHNRLELVITKEPGGIVSTYVHEYLHQGDELKMSGPYGDFYLRPSDRKILLIATGSGLAPMRSILFQIAHEKIERETTLLFGAKNTQDLYYYDELKALEQSMPQFRFIPTLSRVTDEEAWEGARGRVTKQIQRIVQEKDPFDVYICGAPPMVESCQKILTQKGIPEDRIYFDKFA
jgi:Na+-transporting NADH:ubiquinone oxidoreductase subunit F